VMDFNLAVIAGSTVCLPVSGPVEPVVYFIRQVAVPAGQLLVSCQ
jgi:hypothetical protein